MSGYGYSGSSAFNDLLLEMDNFMVLGDELRFLVDPDGFVQTEMLLRHAWNPFVCDMAIRRLQDMLRRLGRHKAWPYYNQNHNREISPHFNEAADRLIAGLADLQFPGMWLGINDPFEYRRRHIKKWTAGLIDRDYNKPMFFCGPDKDFRELARNFLREILSDHAGKHIMLDEGYASLNPAEVLKYFDNGKMIISERDPRDVYFEIVRKNARFIPREPEKFVFWYKAVRERNRQAAQSEQNVLSVKFEELVLDYDKTVGNILSFLEVEPAGHTLKRTRLIPEKSARNVGKWKTFADQKIMDYIGLELADYCWKN
jgi:hypothetical protein